MNRKDLDALNELYLGVYDGEQLNEAPVTGFRPVDRVLQGAQAFIQGNPRPTGTVNRQIKTAQQYRDAGGVGVPPPNWKPGQPTETNTPTATKTAPKFADLRGSNTPGSNTPAIPKVKYPVAGTPPTKTNTPTATKTASTPPTKPTTTAATPAPKPAAAPAAKPAGSAMDQFAKANPKLAASAAERDRTRGTSATTNPLMKDMKSRLPAPKTPSPTTAKTGFDLAKKGVNLAAGFDMFDVVKGYLIGEGYADTEEAALAIMINMSEEWKQSIIKSI